MRRSRQLPILACKDSKKNAICFHFEEKNGLVGENEGEEVWILSYTDIGGSSAI